MIVTLSSSATMAPATIGQANTRCCLQAPVGYPDITRVVQDGMNSDNMPVLSSDPNGPVRLVTQTSSAKAAARFWEMLLAPSTFHAQ